MSYLSHCKLYKFEIKHLPPLLQAKNEKNKIQLFQSTRILTTTSKP